jgi:molybdopterin converting factor small subunit
MNVKVKGYLTYRKVIGERTFQFPDDSPIRLIEFVEHLAEDIGGEHGEALFDREKGSVGSYVAIMLNGQHYNHLPDRLDTLLRDQDEIAVFPPGAGG